MTGKEKFGRWANGVTGSRSWRILVIATVVLAVMAAVLMLVAYRQAAGEFEQAFGFSPPCEDQYDQKVVTKKLAELEKQSHPPKNLEKLRLLAKWFGCTAS